ncbi:MAG: SMP-30/gluconolactonase/LRE family protein [Myxococcota bacterium]|jgi:xylono-1,5-lactonase|nr:SMP-30/gluconolactonase/LRE family protein [Myxococcota bacterium]
MKIDGTIEPVLSGYGLIEGPRVDDDDALYFCDARLGGVHRLTPDGEVETVVPRRKGVGGIVLHQDGGIVVSGRDLSHVHGGKTRTIYSDPEAPRFNDIFTDTLGRIYAGSLRFDPFGKQTEPEPGSLYRVDAEGEATILYGDVALTNGIGFSPDHRVLYHSDSLRSHVIAHDINENGLCINRRVFVKLPAGAPDGICVDESGCVWIAAYGAGRVVRVTPEGHLDGELKFSEPRVTSVCFGGNDRRDLYIVTADDGTTDTPQGSIYRTRVETAGLSVPRASV